ncbi:superoxide dismutase [Xylariaceae sp. FL0594]|nr:superoxide dismutase [Xylariaceae sp. FL0594]
MRLSSVFSLYAASAVWAQNETTGKLGDAVPVTGNPVGKQAVAVLPVEPFFKSGALNGNIKGSIKASSGAQGAGVDYTVSFSNLPTEGGPFIYHIHVNPVDGAGNCTNTLAHLDPFIRGEDPPCNSTTPAKCQVGDLSGKYGKITSDPFTAQFHDDFTSMQEGPGSYFLNRSIVVHFANKTRITCANFVVQGCPANATVASNGTCLQSPAPVSSPTYVPVGGAGMLTVFGGVALVPLVAMLLSL